MIGTNPRVGRRRLDAPPPARQDLAGPAYRSAAAAEVCCVVRETVAARRSQTLMDTQPLLRGTLPEAQTVAQALTLKVVGTLAPN